MIEKMKKNKDRGYSMERLYRYLGVTRQALHKQKKAAEKWDILARETLAKVAQIRKRHPKMGARVMYHTLGITGMGINKFKRLISQNNLTVQIKKKRSITTDSRGSKRYPNLTNGLVLTGINQLIVADITYYRVDNQFFYIFTLKDVYSQRVISLIASDNMKAINAMKAMEDFNDVRGEGPFLLLIHHTDNGTQYDFGPYKDVLLSLGIEISRAKNSLENGSSENLNRLIKHDYLFDHKRIKTVKQLQDELDELKWKLNNERAIKSLGYKTVVEFEEYILSIPEEERPRKQLYDHRKEGKG